MSIGSEYDCLVQTVSRYKGGPLKSGLPQFIGEKCMSNLTQPEGLVSGMAAKMFTVAGPVIVYGTAASVVYGVILVLFR